MPAAITQTTATLRLERTLPSPAERVYQAFTDPAVLTQWWGPPGYEATNAEIDLRVGGRYRIAMRKQPDGEPFYLAGEYVEIVPNKRLVYTWSWEGKEMDSTATRVTLEFTPRGKASSLMLLHELFTTDELRDRHDHGWSGSFDKLSKLMEEQN